MRSARRAGAGASRGSRTPGQADDDRSAVRSPGGSEPPAARWTFLTNYSHVLVLLFGDPSVVLRDVAAKVGITERAVQRIIAELEAEGFIEREKVGRQNRYRIRTDLPLRHPIEADCTIGDLLRLIHRQC